MANQAPVTRPLSLQRLKENPEFISGIDRAANLDIVAASDKLRRLVHQHPHCLPDIITPLTRICIQTDAPEKLQILIAELFMMTGWYTEAIQELADILDTNPTHSVAYQLLSKIWSRAPQHTEIEQLFENALEIGHFDSAILDILPKIYLGKTDLSKSIRLYQQLIQRDPSATHLRLTLGNLYTKSNQIDDAVATFEDILQESPLHAADIANRLDTLVDTHPNCKTLRKALFKLHAKLYNLSHAETHFQALLEKFPNHIGETITLLREVSPHYPNTPDIQLMLARAFSVAHEYSQAITALQQVIENGDRDQVKQVKTIALDILDRYPNQVYAMQLLVDVGITQQSGQESIQHLHDLLQYDALDDSWLNERFTVISSLDPSLDAEIKLLKAKRYLQQRRFDQAIVEIQGLAGTPFSKEARSLVATAYELKGDLVKSDTTLLDALKEHPFDTHLHSQLVHLKERWIEQEITAHVDRVDSDDPFYLATCFLAQGAYYPAMTHFQKIPATSGTYLKAQLLISRCFLELGRFDQAITHLNRLTETSTLDRVTASHCRYIAGANHFLKGDLDRCIDTLESILPIDLAFANVNDLIQRLRSESSIPYRVKAASGINHGRQLMILSVKNPDTAPTQPLSFAHPHNNAGVDYMFKHQYKTAEDEFKLALQMDPHLAVVYCNFSLLKLAQSNLSDALDLLKSAEKIATQFDLLHSCKGLILMQQNQWQAALTAFETAFSIRSDNYATLINLGDCHYKLNNVKTAISYWQTANAQHPVSHLIQRRLGYLIPLTALNTCWETGLIEPILECGH